jgi:UDP-N-acetylmuramoyl-tripeptide--D-alanyl-D-alanine ligase
MGELGPRSPEFHREVGGVVHKLGVDCLIGIGTLAAGYIEGAREAERVAASGSRSKVGGTREYHYFADRETALKQVPGLIRAGDVVLVKASRFMRLEQLSDVLAGASETGAAASSPSES